MLKLLEVSAGRQIKAHGAFQEGMISSGIICPRHRAPYIGRPASKEKSDEEGEAALGYEPVPGVVLGIEQSNSFAEELGVRQPLFSRPLERLHVDENECTD